MNDRKWLVGLTVCAAVLAKGGAAHAQDGSPAPNGTPQQGAPQETNQPSSSEGQGQGQGAQAAEGQAAGAAEASASASVGASATAEAEAPTRASEEPKEEEKQDDPNVDLFIDLVIGFGKTPFAIAQPPESFSTTPTYAPGNVQSTTTAFILGGGYKFTQSLGVGLRLPFTFASFDPDIPGNAVYTISGRSATTLGNIELSARYERKASEVFQYAAALGVTLPTAQGLDALPSREQLAATDRVDFNEIDRFSANRAAALARGYEENPLFFADRVGVIPKLSVDYRAGKLAFSPYVKMHNLFATRSSMKEKYLGEVVPGLRAGYSLSKNFEAAVRVWGNIAFAGSSDADKVAVAAEPQVVGHFGPVKPVVGVILPIVGAPADPYFVGVRVGLGASF